MGCVPKKDINNENLLNGQTTNSNNENSQISSLDANNDKSALIIQKQAEQFIEGPEHEAKMIFSKVKLQTKISVDDFQLMKLLGRGSFGKVFLVEKQLYAMKILKKSQIAKRNQILHTKSERDILARSDHPFIVGLHYAFQTQQKLYMLTEFMQGGELFFHLRKSYKFTEQRAKFYTAEIILALEYLHQNDIVYRDLKPENIIMDSEGHIKITDFGLSKEGIGDEKKTYTLCGTPEYLAPEILLGDGHDKAVDWWSLGALLYEMLCGLPPFYSKDKNQMFKNILEKPIPMKPYFSQEAVSILMSLLCLDPKKRLGSSHQDAQEIKQHAFFAEIDWEKLYNKAYQTPFKPKITGPLDLRNFEKIFTEEGVKEDTVPSQNDSKQQEDYYGFTYVKSEKLIIENPNFGFRD